MLTEETTAPESQVTVTTAAPEDAVGAPAQESETPYADKLEAATKALETPKGEAAEATPAEPATQPTFQPNYKFKTMGKEHEIPDYLKAVIKDEKSQKEVHDLMTKAFGLEPIKSDRERLRTEFDSYKKDTEPLVKNVMLAEAHYSRGDVDKFLDVTGFDPKVIFKWALQKAQEQDLPQEQRDAYNKRVEAERRAFDLEQSLHSRETQMLEYQRQQTKFQLETELSKPDVQSLQSQFDSIHGENAFKKEIVRRGEAYWAQGNVYKPPTEIVAEVTAHYSPLFQHMQSSQQAPAPHAGGQPPITTTQEHKPVIPKVGGSGASPARKKVGSVDDIRRIANEKYGFTA